MLSEGFSQVIVPWKGYLPRITRCRDFYLSDKPIRSVSGKRFREGPPLQKRIHHEVFFLSLESPSQPRTFLSSLYVAYKCLLVVVPREFCAVTALGERLCSPLRSVKNHKPLSSYPKKRKPEPTMDSGMHPVSFFPIITVPRGLRAAGRSSGSRIFLFT